MASRALRDLTRRRGDGLVVLDAARLAATEVAIARRVVREAVLSLCPEARLEARHVAGVLAAVAAGEGSLTVPLGVDVRVEHALLSIRARSADPRVIASWLEVPGRLELPGGRGLEARVLRAPRAADVPAYARSHALEWSGESVLLDAVAAGVDPARGGRLWVDAPRAGELLCPLGMHGQSKKLSDLLGETHMSRADRALVPVVHASPTGPVLWVAGVRADERARCVPQTEWLLELTLVSGA